MQICVAYITSKLKESFMWIQNREWTERKLKREANYSDSLN